MALEWIQVDRSFLHTTAPRLAAVAGCSVGDAIRYALTLWEMGVELLPRELDLGAFAGEGGAERLGALMGLVAGETAERQIETAIGWTGELGAFVRAGVELGLLERTEKGLRVRGLHRYAKTLLASRKAAEKQRGKRERRRVREQNASASAPSPSAKAPEGDASGPPPGSPVDASQATAPGPEGERPVLELRPSSGKGKRELSTAEKMLRLMEKDRREALGESWLPDCEYSAGEINKMFKGEIRTVDKGLLRQAFELFLADPRARAADPPCPVRWFAQDWPKWVSKATRTEQATGS